MKKTITLKIDVNKIDKNKLFKGEKGTYLDAVLFLDEQDDQYGNNGMIVQSVSKEERERGVQGAILGNAKLLNVRTNTEQSKGKYGAEHTEVNHNDESNLPF